MELTEEQLQEIVNRVEKKLTKATEGKTFRPIASGYFKPITGNVSRNQVSELELETEIIDEENTDKIAKTLTSKHQETFLSPELLQVVEKLSQETNQSGEEILRKAIALIRIAILSQEQGANLAIVKNGKILNEITGFLNSGE